MPFQSFLGSSKTHGSKKAARLALIDGGQPISRADLMHHKCLFKHCECKPNRPGYDTLVEVALDGESPLPPFLHKACFERLEAACLEQLSDGRHQTLNERELLKAWYTSKSNLCKPRCEVRVGSRPLLPIEHANAASSSGSTRATGAPRGTSDDNGRVSFAAAGEEEEAPAPAPSRRADRARGGAARRRGEGGDGGRREEKRRRKAEAAAAAMAAIAAATKPAKVEKKKAVVKHEPARAGTACARADRSGGGGGGGGGGGRGRCRHVEGRRRRAVVEEGDTDVDDEHDVSRAPVPRRSPRRSTCGKGSTRLQGVGQALTERGVQRRPRRRQGSRELHRAGAIRPWRRGRSSHRFGQTGRDAEQGRAASRAFRGGLP